MPNRENTKNKIADVFYNLLKNNSFYELTITEISQHADISRPTFYNCFSQKEDILNFIILKKNQDLINYYNKLSHLNLFTIANGFFKFWLKNKELIFILEKNGLFSYFIQEKTSFYNIVSTSFKKEFLLVDEVFKDYHVCFHVSGLTYILRKWLLEGYKESPKELTQLYINILHKRIKYNEQENGIPQI